MKEKSSAITTGIRETVVSNQSLGVLETLGVLPMAEAVDTMLKVAPVEIIRFDKLGVGWMLACISGNVGAVKVAIEAGYGVAQRHSERGVATAALQKLSGATALPFAPVASCMLANPNPELWNLVLSKGVRLLPRAGKTLGYVEVYNFTTAILTIDAMLKSANISFSGYGGVHPSMVIWVSGDVGAVRHAIDAGVKVASDAGSLIDSGLISRPQPQIAETVPARFGIGSYEAVPIQMRHLLRLGPPAKLQDAAAESFVAEKKMKKQALGILASTGWGRIAVGLDAMMKAANIELAKFAMPGGPWICLYVVGEINAVRMAIDTALAAGTSTPSIKLQGTVISSPTEELLQMYDL